VMYNSMNPSFKEGAAFALAAAQNYEWMNYEWLQCNRAFLSADSQSWKSVLMVQCQLKLEERSNELNRFHRALARFSNGLPEVQKAQQKGREPQVQLSLFGETTNQESGRPIPLPGNEKEVRLSGRVNVMMQVAP
jgi:hypothetical protein